MAVRAPMHAGCFRNIHYIEGASAVNGKERSSLEAMEKMHHKFHATQPGIVKMLQAELREPCDELEQTQEEVHRIFV